MTFSVPPNQNHHLMTSCMVHVRLDCAFPSFSLQHFSSGGGLCCCCERCHFVRRWTDDHSSDGGESGSDDCVGTEYCKLCEWPQTGEGSSTSKACSSEKRTHRVHLLYSG